MVELEKTLVDAGKFPRPDNIIVKFYKFLWPLFGTEYLSMLQGAIERDFYPWESRKDLLHKGRDQLPSIIGSQ